MARESGDDAVVVCVRPFVVDFAQLCNDLDISPSDIDDDELSDSCLEEVRFNV